MNEKIRSQVLKIRDSGETNMLDIPVVQRIAFQRKYYELVDWIAEHRSDYATFILTGKEPADESE